MKNWKSDQFFFIVFQFLLKGFLKWIPDTNNNNNNKPSKQDCVN